MSSQHDPILVTGATGQQGGATARRLLADGIAVRALVRDPQSAAARDLAASGAELVTGDLDRPESLAPAVAGTRGVFLVPPVAFGPTGWDVDLEASRGIHVIEAAARAGVEHIVFTGVASMSGDAQRDAAGKRRIEAALIDGETRYTVLRPVRFMENYLIRDFPVDGIADGVNHHIFRADRPLQMIAVADIGLFAAMAFANPDRFHGEILEIAGDDPTPDEAAATITRVTGHPVRYRELTEAEAEAFGTEIAGAWRLSRETGGWRADIAALRELHPGLLTLETWLTTGGSAKLATRREQQRADAGR